MGTHLGPRRIDLEAEAFMNEFMPGNRIRLLRTGSEYFPALAAAIDAARRQLHLETYIVEADATGHAIAAALCRAAARVDERADGSVPAQNAPLRSPAVQPRDSL